MKSLVVYYSLEGHTRFIADMIIEELGADRLELKPKKEIPKSGFLKFFLGGKSVIFHERPKLLTAIPELDSYDLIVIGTPVWASSFTAPINTFLAHCGINGRKLALFACHAGGGTDKCFDRIKKILRNNQILGTIDFRNPAQENKDIIKTQIQTWISGFTENKR
ncbi:flavodoxin family protein [Sinanaerobacter chloroacetimidivorans]|uniref:NAD(P)H-dependent oxidoreductase n=1 Tax=Sinanaerobacter chloroacetimidivorans TaxID=2818044 RepID=A0A8J7W455_9FIRM|nr:flavodoxin [Sinanaerobacter chloroacetimidivorans]MBR0599008.1 NAD(P)H-dependent oxidoreductase [Sinanaerobacter chloroacetimidivorans]